MLSVRARLVCTLIFVVFVDALDEEVLLTKDGGEKTKKLLYVHQIAWQKQLLSLYGNDICLFDATYKTTRYALPVFFLAVKTNVDSRF